MCIRDRCTTIVGALAGKCSEGGCNAIFGARAGFNNTSGDFNTFLGFDAACSSTSGSNNVAIGKAVQLPSLTGDTQLAIGAGATTWITGNDTFKVGIGTTTYTSSLNVHKDIGGYQVLSAEGEGSTTLTVITIDKTAKHRYPSGGGSSTKGYEIDGAESPYLTLTPGRTYRFEQSDSSNDNHPLIFYLEANKTTEYTAGVSYYADGARVDSSAFSSAYNSASVRYTEITVSDETPLVLHYQCYNHGYMGNAISFPNNVLNTNYQSTIRADLHVTGIATFGSASLKLDGTNNIINVGAALTLGHSQGIQYHTQNLHATGFAVNQINASGITTFTNVKVGTGATIESNGNATLGIVTATAFHGSGAGLTGITANFEQDAQGNLVAGVDAGANITTGSEYNIFLGQNAGKEAAGSAQYNVLIGCDAGCKVLSDDNVFIGRQAGHKLVSGHSNVFVGTRAGCNFVGLFNNVFIGSNAGRKVTTGNSNTLIGAYAGGFLGGSITGYSNIALGPYVCLPDPAANNQLAIGLGSTTWINGNANWNVGIGTQDPDAPVGAGVTAKLSVGIVSAFTYYGDGSNLTNVVASGQGIIIKDNDSLIGTAGTINFATNLSVSAISGAAVTITSQGLWTADVQENLFAGTCSGYNRDADTCFNIGIGYSAGEALNEGDENIFIGRCSGTKAVTASNNVFLGSNTGEWGFTGEDNVFAGTGAGRCKQGGSENVAIGPFALLGSSTPGLNQSNSNIAIGMRAGALATSGSCNILIGRDAGICMGTGCMNVAIGRSSASGNTVTGNYNALFGERAARDLTGGSRNTVIGRWAGKYLTDGSHNTLIGHVAGCHLSTGWYNTTVGDQAGRRLTTGVFNTFLGSYAGHNVQAGSNNVVIGCKVDLAGGDQASGELRIGAGSTILISGDFDAGTVTLAGLATANPTAGILSTRDFHTDQLSVTGLSTFTANVSIASTLFVKARAGYGRDQLIIGDESTHNEQIKLWRQNNGSTIDFTHDDDPNAVRSADILALRSNYGTSTSNTFNGFGIDIDGDQIYPSHNFKPNLGTPTVTFGNIYATGIVTSGNSVGIITYYGDGSKLQGVAGGLNVQDEGVTLATQATTLNFEGAGVVASGTGATKTITISGGGGSTGAWSPDDDQNLYAGTRAGRCLDGTNGCFNVLLGCNAGQCTDSGAENIFVGRGAGFGNEGGDYNICLLYTSPSPRD